MKEILKNQVVETIDKYLLSLTGPIVVEDLKAAMLSGMSLTAAFLARHDGSKEITAQLMVSVLGEVGLELNLEAGKIERRIGGK
jgi:hypothetical protein